MINRIVIDGSCFGPTMREIEIRKTKRNCWRIISNKIDKFFLIYLFESNLFDRWVKKLKHTKRYEDEKICLIINRILKVHKNRCIKKIRWEFF